MCIACEVAEKYGNDSGELLWFHALRVRLGILKVLSCFTGTMAEAQSTMEDRDLMALFVTEFVKASPYSN